MDHSTERQPKPIRSVAPSKDHAPPSLTRAEADPKKSHSGPAKTSPASSSSPRVVGLPTLCLSSSSLPTIDISVDTNGRDIRNMTSTCATAASSPLVASPAPAIAPGATTLLPSASSPADLNTLPTQLAPLSSSSQPAMSSYKAWLTAPDAELRERRRGVPAASSAATPTRRPVLSGTSSTAVADGAELVDTSTVASAVTLHYNEKFWVDTNLAAVQKAPKFAAFSLASHSRCCNDGEADGDGECQASSEPQLAVLETQHRSDGVSTMGDVFGELTDTFTQHFDGGKVHTRPPWHLCTSMLDNLEHPYYLSWMDELEVGTTAEEVKRAMSNICKH